MDTSALKVFLLLLLSVLRMPEVSSKNNKIKIVVPHKISVIHHHHSKITDPRPKKKLHFDLHESNQIQHREEESEEDVSEEGRLGHFPDERLEATRRGVAYYAIPTADYSNPVRIYMKPVLLYDDSFDGRHPPRFEHHKYEDNLYYPEETYRGNVYLRGFPYK